MGLPDTLPCQCTNPNCGLIFQARNPVGGGGSNITFTGNMTNCPRCGQTAYFADWNTDSQGRFHLKGFFSTLSNVKDVEKLRKLKDNLEAANETITAHELADTLVEIEPGFKEFKVALKSIPENKINFLVQTLLTIITLVIMLKTLQSSDENHKESINLQREQFEYQKERDKIQDETRLQEGQERERLQKQIEQLQREFEEKIETINNEARTKKEIQPSMRGSRLKGSSRNKPCPCGSEIKAKKCHPNGYPI